MHIFINHLLKRAIITHPKVAGTTVSNVLDWAGALKNQAHPNINGWKQIASDSQENYLNLRTVKQLIPNDYKTTLLYRDPIKRYISGFNFLLLEDLDLVGLDRTTPEHRLEYWGKKNQEWYNNYVYQILKMSGWMYGLNNNHTERVLLVIWILFWELPNSELLYIDNLDDWIRSVHDLPPHFEIPRHNAAINNFDMADKSDQSIKLIQQKFQTTLEILIQQGDGLRDYLHLDRRLFKQLRHLEVGHVQKISNIAVTVEIIEQVFNECYPIHDHILHGSTNAEKNYLRALAEWAKNGTDISSESKQLINNKITQIVTRYNHVAEREFKIDV